MNEKDRILELVQKGIISSEEAIVLLEQIGTKLANQQVCEQKEQPEEATAEQYEAADRHQLDKILEGIASAITTFSATVDEKAEAMHLLKQQVQEKRDRLEELATLKELDTLTVDQEMEMKRIEEELSVLTSQAEALAVEQAEAEAQMKQMKKKELDETLRKMKQKVENTDWKQTTADSVNQFGSVVGKFAGQFAKAVTETVKSVSEAVQNDENAMNLFSRFGACQAYRYHQLLSEASIVEIKVANGDVRIKTAPQQEVTIEGEIRIAAGTDEVIDMESFIQERVQVNIDDEKFIFEVASKRLYCDVTIILPDKEYDYISVKGLNLKVRLKELRGKDFYVDSKNGSVSLKDVTGTMLEVVATNGHVKQIGGYFKDNVIKGTNGDILLTGQILSAQVETINGNVKIKLLDKQAKKITATTINGNIALRFLDSLGLEANLQTSLGKLQYEPEQYEILQKEKATTNKAVLLRKQTQGLPVQFDAKTTTGSIKIIQIQLEDTVEKNAD